MSDTRTGPYMLDFGEWGDHSDEAERLGIPKDAFGDDDEVLLVWKQENHLGKFQGIYTLSRIVGVTELLKALKIPVQG